jgi:hypothetical protein
MQTGCDAPAKPFDINVVEMLALRENAKKGDALVIAIYTECGGPTEPGCYSTKQLLDKRPHRDGVDIRSRDGRRACDRFLEYRGGRRVPS